MLDRQFLGRGDQFLRARLGGLLSTTLPSFSSFAAPIAPTSLDLQNPFSTSGTVTNTGTSSILYESSSWSRYAISLSGELWTTMEKSGSLPGSTKVGGLSATLNPDGNLLGRDKGSDSWIFSDISGSTFLRGLVGGMGVGETVQIDAIKYAEMDAIKNLPVDINVTAGQSLGLGTDPVMDGAVDGWTDARMSAVHMTSDDSIIAGQEFPLTAPLNHQNGGRSGVCPSIHMGKTMEGYTEDGRRTLFLAANWGGSAIVDPAAEWNVANNGAAWAAMTSTLDALLASLPAGSRVQSLVWDHGPSEYGNLDNGLYQVAVPELVSAFRARYGNVPVFISGNIPSAVATKSPQLIAVQQEFATGSGAAHEIADCYFVARTADMVTIDGTHPDAAAQRGHGVNLGTAWRKRFNSGIPSVSSLIAMYDSTGFVDDGTGSAERWDESFGSGLNLTQTIAGDRVAISGDALDWGLTGLNSQRYVTPTWPSIPKTIAVVYKMPNGATVWPEFHDWVGGNGLSVSERANRICTDDGTNTFFTEQSGAATLYRNNIQTSEFLATPERIVAFFTNPAGIPFTTFGNNDVSNRNLVGETAALFVFSEVLTETERQTVIDASVLDYGVVLGVEDTTLADRVDAISSYASVYDLVNDTSLYTKGTATDRYNMASTAKTTGAILVYDKIADPNDTTTWDTLVTGASNMSGIGAAGGTRYLQVGQQYPLGDLLRISMIASSNTAATMIGVWLQENEPESYPTLAANFYDSIGMLGTEGSNPAGQESDVNSNFTTREDALVLAQHIEAGANYNSTPAGGVSLVDVMGSGTYVCPTVNGNDLTVTHSTDLVTRYPGLSIKGGSLSGTACAVGIYENATGGKIAIVVGDGPDSDTRWEDVEWAILKYGG